jgi:hypothetical protein
MTPRKPADTAALSQAERRDQPPEDTVMEEAPDFPVEAAGQVMDALNSAGVKPPDGVEDLLPDWSNLHPQP